ncbi:WD40/YVTN/BNR-like repeat-containing protein [Ferroacidibacillus organovorans]|uniref:Photosynthesis system II assembly factor Ycf48/Hcf136-like domain-containing protein n=1 Tax=Ferroacidibacillus organovorans TaxID=1765683 RepID=A0A162RTJ5_9BACL|nr:hypothetical protein [Ferroacidibacillus organovorans]KYP79244.1 hypothetical protein AYJ22_15265 [Ferroacidibacillus organovorans]OAG87760.1 hypothetical protein AYW79_14710 [Ferroacidibacillus organovorans]OPG15381.1 hypothetical protein B2M26_12155 [Ferroacidibacillus organovorans]
MVFPSFTARVALVALSAVSLLSILSPASMAPSFAHYTEATPQFPIISKMDSASDKEMPYSALGVVAQIAMFHSGYGWAASSLGVFQTSDSGTHWVRTLRGDAAIKSNGQTDFLNKNTAYAILPANNTQSYLYVTHDGGRKWNRNLVPIEAQSVIQISFANSRVGLMMTAPHGAAGPLEPIALYKTKDGGVKWNPTKPLLTKSSVIYDILNATHIFAKVGQTLYESKKVGQSWYVAGNHAPSGTTLIFVSPSDGYAVGTTLWKTVTGGKTWSKIR